MRAKNEIVVEDEAIGVPGSPLESFLIIPRLKRHRTIIGGSLEWQGVRVHGLGWQVSQALS